MIKVLARPLTDTGFPKCQFSSNSYSVNSKIPNFRVYKIRIGYPKDGWMGL